MSQLVLTELSDNVIRATEEILGGNVLTEEMQTAGAQSRPTRLPVVLLCSINLPSGGDNCCHSVPAFQARKVQIMRLVLQKWITPFCPGCVAGICTVHTRMSQETRCFHLPHTVTVVLWCPLSGLDCSASPALTRLTAHHLWDLSLHLFGS